MSIPRPSCQESWWGLLGQKGHCFPPEAVAWAPELLLLSLNTPHLSLFLGLSASYTHLMVSLFKSISQHTQCYMDTLLRPHVDGVTSVFDIRLDCNTEGGLRKEYHCVGVDYFFLSGREWKAVTSCWLCLCVHPHCVTQVYRLDNKLCVFVCECVLSPFGRLQAWIRLFKRLYHCTIEIESQSRFKEVAWMAGWLKKRYCQFHRVRGRSAAWISTKPSWGLCAIPTLQFSKIFQCNLTSEDVLQCARLYWNGTHLSQISAACRQLPKLSNPLLVSDRPHLSQSQHLCCELCSSAFGWTLQMTAAYSTTYRIKLSIVTSYCVSLL